MKKRLVYLAWFGFAVLVCIMSVGLYANGGPTRMRWMLFGIGSAVVAVCALIGLVFPDKMTRLFFGSQGVVMPGQHRDGRTMILDRLHGRENED